MPRIMQWILLFAATLTLATAAPAQKTFHPEKFERATQKDESGRVQWAEHQEVKCPNCNGTGKHKCTTCERYPEDAKKCPDCGLKEGREAVCHSCAGTGKFPDPLEQVTCPGCLGAGYVMCGVCPGTGMLQLPGNPRWSNCIGCRGEGWHDCAVCKGARLVESIKLKPSLVDADAATLKKALAATAELLQKTESFQHTPKVRKDVKELEKLMKAGEKLFPSFKLLPANFEVVMKSIYTASSYQGQHEREVAGLERTQAAMVFFLKHQRRLLELAVKRAEENEKLGGGD